MNARSFLINGLIAGLLGGLIAFVVAIGVGEPAIDDAIAVEEAAAAPADTAVHDHDHDETEEGAAHSHSHGDEEGGITRGQQAGPGLATATVLVGAVLGGLVGIASAFAAGRFGRLSPVATTALVTAVGFVAVVLAPWLKYPPNPPATGSGDTIGERTALYFGFLAISILAVVAAIIVARQVLAGRSAWLATAVGGAVYLAVVGVAFAVMAPIDEVPNSFPANTLFEFRVGSLITQAALWLVLGVVLTGLVNRAWNRDVDDLARRDAAAAL
ncbi:CbtA family protein [Aeromicrobium sp.]|uniref:CbtA family protein n=1 Tax=Aeromicrobium sp. TaxID=1871063 RepID=UPI0025BAC5A4|nr:CbtA family protein [Aeromicrobium sp.]MCK5890445.1 CbtA family protein [Aeromicrobium sp.]